MKNILIYGLVSSHNIDVIKYVGKTCQKISKRIHDHIRESYKLKTKKDIWIQDVINNSNKIQYIILEECDESNWCEKEKKWISSFEDLTNISKGGDEGRKLKAKLTYQDLRSFSHKNMTDVKNSIDWVYFVKNNTQYNFLPKYPYASYKNRGWVSWEDLLINYNGSNSNRRNAFREIFSYDECVSYLVNFSFKSKK